MPSSLKVSRVQRKGQVTIPQEIRERHGIQEGDFVAFIETEAGILITPQAVISTDVMQKVKNVMSKAPKLMQSKQKP